MFRIHTPAPESTGFRRFPESRLEKRRQLDRALRRRRAKNKVARASRKANR